MNQEMKEAQQKAKDALGLWAQKVRDQLDCWLVALINAPKELQDKYIEASEYLEETERQCNASAEKAGRRYSQGGAWHTTYTELEQWRISGAQRLRDEIRKEIEAL